MAWELTDEETTDTYPTQFDVINAIKLAMTKEDYLEVARGWGWRVKEVPEKEFTTNQ